MMVRTALAGAPPTVNPAMAGTQGPAYPPVSAPVVEFLPIGGPADCW